MKLKNSTMVELLETIKDKKLYCFGAGSLLLEMINEYRDFLEKRYIYKIIDNNKRLQNTKMLIGEVEIPIISVEDFLSEVNIDSIVLFTMFHSFTPFLEFDAISKLRNIDCYHYRMIKGADYDFELMKSKLPNNALNNSGKEQIPRKIHYCWFGNNELPELAKKCIESWKKYCPNYEIIRWDESNYDVGKNAYMHDAYLDGKWAFVSDYARLDIIYNHGGIYLDTDVEIIRSLDSLLYEYAFCGFESLEYINFGIGFGSVERNKIIKEILKFYINLKWDGGKVACPIYQTHILKKYGLVCNNSFQKLKDITVLPAECFAGKSVVTKEINITPNTYSIHHFAASWYEYTKEEKDYLKLWERLRKDEKYHG